jgi:hypothetical protein
MNKFENSPKVSKVRIQQADQAVFSRTTAADDPKRFIHYDDSRPEYAELHLWDMENHGTMVLLRGTPAILTEALEGVLKPQVHNNKYWVIPGYFVNDEHGMPQYKLTNQL